MSYTLYIIKLFLKAKYLLSEWVTSDYFVRGGILLSFGEPQISMFSLSIYFLIVFQIQVQRQWMLADIPVTGLDKPFRHSKNIVISYKGPL